MTFFTQENPTYLKLPKYSQTYTKLSILTKFVSYCSYISIISNYFPINQVY